MPPSISSYILSPETEQDLNDVFDYTEGVYGFDQAVSYLSEFDDIFHQLIDNPELGRIRIVRILHGSCDLPNSLR